MGLTRCRGDFGLGEASAVEIAETGVPKILLRREPGLRECRNPVRGLAAGAQGSTALRRPLSAGALTRTYPPLTQHYWDLSRSEPTNSLRTPLIRVVWGYRETQ